MDLKGGVRDNGFLAEPMESGFAPARSPLVTPRLEQAARFLLQDDGFPAEDYALVATAVLERGEGSRAAQLLTALETHRWADLLALRYWEGARDNIEAYVVRSTDGRLAVVAVLDPVEPLVAPRLVRRDYLTSGAAQELLDTLRPDWRALDRVE